MIVVVITFPQDSSRMVEVRCEDRIYVITLETIFKDYPYTSRMARNWDHAPDNILMSSMHKSEEKALIGSIKSLFMSLSGRIDNEEIYVVLQLREKDILIERETISENGVSYNWKVLSDEWFKFVRASNLNTALMMAQSPENLYINYNGWDKVNGLVGEGL